MDCRRLFQTLDHLTKKPPIVEEYSLFITVSYHILVVTTAATHNITQSPRYYCWRRWAKLQQTSLLLTRVAHSDYWQQALTATDRYKHKLVKHTLKKSPLSYYTFRSLNSIEVHSSKKQGVFRLSERIFGDPCRLSHQQRLIYRVFLKLNGDPCSSQIIQSEIFSSFLWTKLPLKWKQLPGKENNVAYHI